MLHADPRHRVTADHVLAELEALSSDLASPPEPELGRPTSIAFDSTRVVETLEALGVCSEHCSAACDTVMDTFEDSIPSTDLVLALLEAGVPALESVRGYCMLVKPVYPEGYYAPDVILAVLGEFGIDKAVITAVASKLIRCEVSLFLCVKEVSRR